jgi:hypothetical protein
MIFFTLILISGALFGDVVIQDTSLVPDKIKEAVLHVVNNNNYTILRAYSAQQKSVEEAKEFLHLVSSRVEHLKTLRDSFERNHYGKALVSLPIALAVVVCLDAFLPQKPVTGFKGAALVNIMSASVWAIVPLSVLLFGATGMVGACKDIYYHNKHVEQQIERLEFILIHLD